MTDTTTPTVHPGQLWEPLGYPGLRDEVIRLVPVDDEMHVVWRGQHSRPQISTVDDFVTNHIDPRWPTAPPSERVRYSAVRLVDGYLSERGACDTIDEARAQLEDLPEHIKPVGVLRIKTITTTEWVTE